MIYIGIDIGSTASKVAIIEKDTPRFFVIPTGWNSKETANSIASKLLEDGIDVESNDVRIVATGYGRIAVDYADFIITEITCHGRGGRELAGDDIGIIDVGGQDTKAILLEKGMVRDFLMNDKCSAGTGKFLEVMANRLGVTIVELFQLAEKGEILPISSLCTVFAESEIINYIGEGKAREDIAAGVIDSVATKVCQLSSRLPFPNTVILTGGLSNIEFFTKILSDKLNTKVSPMKNGKYAGALGAALLAKEKKKR
ncbi:MAG: CoA activase [Tissierellia bacterium]|jgi:predicted CoA-substrate-specific enzyme activase|nr:CoA activase [Tissierellia bacterium]